MGLTKLREYNIQEWRTKKSVKYVRKPPIVKILLVVSLYDWSFVSCKLWLREANCCWKVYLEFWTHRSMFYSSSQKWSSDSRSPCVSLACNSILGWFNKDATTDKMGRAHKASVVKWKWYFQKCNWPGSSGFLTLKEKVAAISLGETLSFTCCWSKATGFSWFKETPLNMWAWPSWNLMISPGLQPEFSPTPAVQDQK